MDLQESAFTPAELDTYDRYWDHVRGERTLLADSHAEGRAEGEQIGMEKGRAAGLDEALARMVASGIPEPEARKILGLSE